MAVTLTTGYPTKQFKSGTTQLILKLTVANSDVYNWDHTELEDTDKIRRIQVISSAGVLNPSGLVATISTATRTILTASGGGAGTYTVVIDF